MVANDAFSGYGPMWAPENSQPDLVGYHWQSPETWLIEAKGYRRLGKAHLWKGARQPLVGVATPAGDRQVVTGLQLAYVGRQADEAGRSTHQRPYLVPGRSGLAVSVPVVGSRRGIAVLPCGAQPCRGLRHRQPYPGRTLRHRASQQQ